MARSLAAAGAVPGDMIQVAYGYGLFTGGLGFHDAAEHMGLTVVPASSGNTLAPDPAAAGLPAAGAGLHAVVRPLHRRGDARAGDRPALGRARGTGCSAPSRGRRRCARSSRRSGALTALDFYGLSEIIGPGVAGECIEGRAGLHVNEDHFLPEIIDPETGEPLPPGQEGELVLTSLTKEALPMLRYRTGDVTSLDPSPCPLRPHDRAHRAHQGAQRRHADHQGRQRLPLAARGGAAGGRGRGAALPARRGPDPTRFPTLEVQVEPTEGVVARVGRLRRHAGPEAMALSARVAERLRGYLGLNPEIAIVPPKTIPRSEGKAVRVIERRGAA